MEKCKSAFKILTGKLTGKGLGVDGRTILQWILKKNVSTRGIALIRLSIGITGEICECSIEPPGSLAMDLVNNDTST